MVQRGDLPDDREELASIRVSLPRSEDDTEASCPGSMQEIMEHLDVEAPGGAQSGSEKVIEFKLKFLGRQPLKARSTGSGPSRMATEPSPMYSSASGKRLPAIDHPGPRGADAAKNRCSATMRRSV